MIIACRASIFLISDSAWAAFLAFLRRVTAAIRLSLNHFHVLPTPQMSIAVEASAPKRQNTRTTSE